MEELSCLISNFVSWLGNKTLENKHSWLLLCLVLAELNRLQLSQNKECFISAETLQSNPIKGQGVITSQENGIESHNLNSRNEKNVWKNIMAWLQRATIFKKSKWKLDKLWKHVIKEMSLPLQSDRRSAVSIGLGGLS